MIIGHLLSLNHLFEWYVPDGRRLILMLDLDFPGTDDTQNRAGWWDLFTPPPRRLERGVPGCHPNQRKVWVSSNKTSWYPTEPEALRAAAHQSPGRIQIFPRVLAEYPFFEGLVRMGTSLDLRLNSHRQSPLLRPCSAKSISSRRWASASSTVTIFRCHDFPPLLIHGGQSLHAALRRSSCHRRLRRCRRSIGPKYRKFKRPFPPAACHPPRNPCQLGGGRRPYCLSVWRCGPPLPLDFSFPGCPAQAPNWFHHIFAGSPGFFLDTIPAHLRHFFSARRSPRAGEVECFW